MTKRTSWWQIGFNDGYAGRGIVPRMATLPGYANGHRAGERKRTVEMYAAHSSHGVPEHCGGHECKAAQDDGVLCANGECDRANGVRPDGVSVARSQPSAQSPTDGSTAEIGKSMETK